MKRLIEGRVFDTEEMDVIAEITLSGEYCTDFGYHAITIAVDKDDNFFKCNYYCFAQENTLEITSRQEVIEWCEEMNYDMDDDKLLACLGLANKQCTCTDDPRDLACDVCLESLQKEN